MAAIFGSMMAPAARAGVVLGLAAALGLGMTMLSGCDQAKDEKPEPKKEAEKKPADGKAPEKKEPEAKPPEKKEPETVSIAVGPKTFKLELAADESVRMKGLGQRDKIADDGGMLFCFKDVQVRGFVMRDCPIDIDIIYLDGAGRVVSFYQMKAEPPRGDGEGKVGDFNNMKYESRLKPYSSRFGCQFVIELKGGTIPSLGVAAGQQVKYDWESLKKRSK